MTKHIPLPKITKNPKAVLQAMIRELREQKSKTTQLWKFAVVDGKLETAQKILSLL